MTLDQALVTRLADAMVAWTTYAGKAEAGSRPDALPADEILRREGITWDADRKTYLAYERAARKAAQPRVSALATHVDAQAPRGGRECPDCGKVFRTPRGVANHRPSCREATAAEDVSAAVATLYEDGVPVMEIATRIRVSPMTIYRALEIEGVPRRNQRRSA